MSPSLAGFAPAPIWRRAAALFADAIILTAVSCLWLVLTGGGTAAALLAVALVAGGISPELEGPFKLGIAVTLLTIFGGLVIMHGIYWVAFTGLRGQTPGKALLGIRVVDAEGRRPGLRRAFMREIIGKFLSKLVCYLGYLWAFADQRHQTWHDKIAGTYVVTAGSPDTNSSGGVHG